MSSVVHVRNFSQFTYDLEKIRCCNYCNKVQKDVCEILHFNFVYETRWMITTESRVLRITLLDSECDSLEVNFKLTINDDIAIGSRYVNMCVGESTTCELPGLIYFNHNKCSQCINIPKLIIALANNCSYKKTKTLQSHNSKFSQKLKILFENANMSDALLVVGNKEFPVHKNLLAAQSQVFYAMFNNDTKEKKENRVKIDDIDPEVMKQLLLYVYTGDVDADSVNDDQAVNLLKAADKYALEELKLISAKIISKNLTTDNVFAIISMAEQYKVNYLKKMAVYLILCNSNEILKSVVDLDLSKSTSDEKNSVTET